MKAIDMMSTVLGINRRNLEFVYPENKRKDFVLVDNKLQSKEHLKTAGLPHVKLLYQYTSYFELSNLCRDLSNAGSFAMKPAHGLGGGGILVINSKKGDHWITTSDRKLSEVDLLSHASDILYGVFSIDNTTDFVLIEEKIRLHPFFNDITFQGIPDIRVIVYHKQPVQAMLRLPTKESDGKANLRLGGIGVGVDLESGKTTNAVNKKGIVSKHPDTGQNLSGLVIPFWEDILEMSATAGDAFPLGYMGLDWVLDGERGPEILELNARPGLEIQNANMQGLRKILKGN